MPGCRPEISVLAYRRAQSAELLEIPGGHFGRLYHLGSAFDLAARVERDFLARHLNWRACRLASRSGGSSSPRSG